MGGRPKMPEVRYPDPPPPAPTRSDGRRKPLPKRSGGRSLAGVAGLRPFSVPRARRSPCRLRFGF
jgi:hypothetical protein